MISFSPGQTLMQADDFSGHSGNWSAMVRFHIFRPECRSYNVSTSKQMKIVERMFPFQDKVGYLDLTNKMKQ